MNTKQILAAAAVFVAASSAFAADAPAAPAAAAAATTIAVTSLNVPAVNVSASNSRSRADVKAEAVDFVKHYKTAFAVQLEQYKN